MTTTDLICAAAQGQQTAKPLTNSQAKQLDEIVNRYVEDKLQVAFLVELVDWLCSCRNDP